MDIVVNFISDFFRAYWFCILWGAAFGWIAFSSQNSEDRIKSRSKFNIGKKAFSFSKNVLKKKRNAPGDDYNHP